MVSALILCDLLVFRGIESGPFKISAENHQYGIVCKQNRSDESVIIVSDDVGGEGRWREERECWFAAICSHPSYPRFLAHFAITSVLRRGSESSFEPAS